MTVSGLSSVTGLLTEMGGTVVVLGLSRLGGGCVGPFPTWGSFPVGFKLGCFRFLWDGDVSANATNAAKVASMARQKEFVISKTVMNSLRLTMAEKTEGQIGTM